MIAGLVRWAGQGRSGLWLGLGLFAALVAMSWIGFIASDDATYVQGAYGWIDAFPGFFVGAHGTIRTVLTVPMALSFKIFGENSFAMVLPCLLYVLAFMVIVWRAVRDAAGEWSAALVLMLLATSPLIVIQSSIADVDVIEMCFLFASVLLFWRCLDQGPDPKRLLMAGALAGCGFLARETAVFVAVFYALFFVAGHRFHRKHYLWIALGFLGAWGLELLYLGLMTGDPLYRFHLSLHHDSSIDRTIDLAGNVIVNPLIDPVLVLLANQEFMALFFLAVPLGGWLCFGNTVSPRIRHFARVIGLFGIVWFVCVGAAQKLLPLNPRYFMNSCAAACILTGMALAQIGWKRRSWLWPLAIFGILASGNLLGIYVENKDSAFAERTLATLAARYPDKVIHTDPATRARADVPLYWVRALDRVVNSPPGPGMLFVYNPASVDTPNHWMTAAQQPVYLPQANWRTLESFEPDAPYLARAIEAT
ncbi:MAG: hypothetical protein RL367_2699, partial [Pseudomonadota bacterium]